MASSPTDPSANHEAFVWALALAPDVVARAAAEPVVLENGAGADDKRLIVRILTSGRRRIPACAILENILDE